jgi:hypothetical protein
MGREKEEGDKKEREGSKRGEAFIRIPQQKFSQ